MNAVLNLVRSQLGLVRSRFHPLHPLKPQNFPQSSSTNSNLKPQTSKLPSVFLLTLLRLRFFIFRPGRKRRRKPHRLKPLHHAAPQRLIRVTV